MSSETEPPRPPRRIAARITKYLLILVAGVAALAVAFVAAAFLLPPQAIVLVNRDLVFERPLAVPPLLEGRREGGVLVFDLAATAGATEFFPGTQTQTLGFNGSYLGPTLRARKGDAVRVNVSNTLGEETTAHWHGMHVPAAMDGGPHQPIAPGAVWPAAWPVLNDAATLWYHPHLMGKTGEQVYRGLAGLFIIDDDVSDALALPRDYGVDDIPLIVQDRRFAADGQLIYDPGHVPGATPGLLDNPPGMLGDTILVNGTRAPYFDAPAKLVRLRILNGSNARRYNFGFSDDRPFQQIATDGGFLAAPVERTRLLLAPAERAEILVDLGSATGPLTLMSYAVVDTVDPLTNLLQRLLASGNDENQAFEILEIRPAAGGSVVETVPPTLRPIARLAEADAAVTRTFSLDFSGATLNGKTMDHNRVDEIVVKGDVEIWTLRNDTISYHPFHIHDVQFQILDRNGQPPPDYELGWKDTVMVSPAETVRLIMQFTTYSDPTLPYMFHCHILEHEDMGMMGQFVVVDSLDDVVALKSPIVGLPGGHVH